MTASSAGPATTSTCAAPAGVGTLHPSAPFPSQLSHSLSFIMQLTTGAKELNAGNQIRSYTPSHYHVTHSSTSIVIPHSVIIHIPLLMHSHMCFSLYCMVDPPAENLCLHSTIGSCGNSYIGTGCSASCSLGLRTFHCDAHTLNRCEGIRI